MVNLYAFSDHDNLARVLKYVVDNSKGLGVNLQVLTKFYLNNLLHVKAENWDKEYRKAYMRLYRFFNALAKDNLVELRKADGLVWVKAKDDRAVDLIFYASKIQTRKTRRRINEYRFTARRFVEHKKRLFESDWEFLNSLFEEYLEYTSSRVLVFLSPDSEIVVKRYSHRFQRRYLRKVKHKFEVIFGNASIKYKVGVFLTLTMDPKRYSSLYDACRRVSVAWNRFMSYLRKLYSFRPSYVAVLEFQDSGNPHLHVVLFGIDRIMDHYKLTEYLKRIGFGEIHYEYQIVNNSGSWVWKNPRKSPKCTTNSVKDYLLKYIGKVFYGSYGGGSSTNSAAIDISDMKISMYFATDKRFFTHSRDLYKAVYYPREYGWRFLGSYDVYDPPDWLAPILDYEYEIWLFPPP